MHIGASKEVRAASEKELSNAKVDAASKIEAIAVSMMGEKFK